VCSLRFKESTLSDALKKSEADWRKILIGMLLAVVVGAGCAGSGSAPTAGSFAGAIPDLRGRRVMVFPVQIRGDVPGDASPEIDFALRTRGAEVDWIFSDGLEDALARSPAMDTRVRGLPVGLFLGGEVRRVGDPLYGQLRRMGALTNSEIAVIPVAVRAGTDAADGGSVVELVVTILNVRDGRVVWFGVVAGRPGELADFGTLASAVEEFAETLLWYVQ
jgi:hypothetical protein